MFNKKTFVLQNQVIFHSNFKNENIQALLFQLEQKNKELNDIEKELSRLYEKFQDPADIFPKDKCPQPIQIKTFFHVQARKHVLTDLTQKKDMDIHQKVSFAIYQIASSKGLTEGHWHIAACYIKGIGCRKSFQKSCLHSQKAIIKNSLDGYCIFALSTSSGINHILF